MKLIKYSALFLIICNIPGWALINLNPVISSMLSYLSFGLMMVFFFLTKNRSANLWMISLGILYFSIGTLVSQNWILEAKFYFIEVIKYFVIVIGGYEIIKNTTKYELTFFLIIGALSVFLELFVFYNPLRDYGRYSGFYNNPNSMGFICMMGYALSFGLNKRWRIVGLIAFSLVGFLTFSRTFMVVWLVINLVSVIISIKNIRVLAMGLVVFLGIMTYNAFLPKTNPRLEAMSNIIEGKKINSSTRNLNEDSRFETWSIYFPALFAKPVFGHGYKAFEGGNEVSSIGPHNAFIKTMGEAGIIPLIVLLTLFVTMIKVSLAHFRKKPYLFLMILSLFLFLNTDHSYWSYGYLLFFSMWLQYQILGDNFLIRERLNLQRENG